MFKMMIRSIAVVSMLALVSPFAAFAVDGGTASTTIAPQAVAVAAPVSSTEADGQAEAPSLVDMILGFFHSVALPAPESSPSQQAGVSPTPMGRRTGLDPMGQSAN